MQIKKALLLAGCTLAVAGIISGSLVYYKQKTQAEVSTHHADNPFIIKSKGVVERVPTPKEKVIENENESDPSLAVGADNCCPYSWD